MKNLWFILFILLSFIVSSGLLVSEVQAAVHKYEPAPKDRDDRRGQTGDENQPGGIEETYEGNERDGGAFDGGGYEEEDGGMIGELFKASLGSPLSRKIITEDRGDVIIRRTVVEKNISENEICSSVTVEMLDKKTRKTISNDRQEACNVIAL